MTAGWLTAATFAAALSLPACGGGARETGAEGGAPASSSTSTSAATSSSSSSSTGGGGGPSVPSSIWKTSTAGDGLTLAIAADPSGGAYVLGWASPGFDVGFGPVEGSTRLFVLALDAAGAPRWMQSFAPELFYACGGIVVEPSGSVVAVVSVEGAFDVGPKHYDGTDNALVLRLGADGDLLDSATFDAGFGVPRDIARTPDGGFAVVGKGLVVWLDASLAVTHAITLPTQDLEAVAARPDGHVLVTGYTWTAHSHGVEEADSDVFVAEVDAQDGLLHQVTIGADAAGARDGTGIVIGPSGPVVFGLGDGVAGLGGPLPAGQATAPFVLALDASWESKAFLVPVDPPASSSLRTGHVVAAKGSLVVAGTAYDQGDSYRSFVTRLDGAAPVWSERYDALEIPAIAATPEGDVLVSGWPAHGFFVEKLSFE